MASDADSSVEFIGERIRAARQRIGYTLDKTAEIAGLSKAHLSRLESAERQPSIAALLSLSGALGVPVSELLGETRDGTRLAISTGEEPRRHSKGLSIASCSGYAGSSAIEALRITVGVERPSTPPSRHRGEEWLYVLDGVLLLEYDGETHRLEAGAAVHFDADRTHRLGAEGRPAELLLVSSQDVRTVHTVY